jgi:hypothetical protein
MMHTIKFENENETGLLIIFLKPSIQSKPSVGKTHTSKNNAPLIV